MFSLHFSSFLNRCLYFKFSRLQHYLNYLKILSINLFNLFSLCIIPISFEFLLLDFFGLLWPSSSMLEAFLESILIFVLCVSKVLKSWLEWCIHGCGMPTDELPVTEGMKSWCCHCKCYEFLCPYQIAGSSGHCWGLWALLLMLRRRIWQRGRSLSRYSAALHLISLSLVQDSTSFVLRISASGNLLTQFLCDKLFLAPEVVEEMQSPAAAG